MGDGEASGDSIARTRAAQEGFASKVIFESTLEPGGAGEGYCCQPGCQRRSWQTLSGTRLRLAGWVSLPLPPPQPSRPRLDSKVSTLRSRTQCPGGFIHKRDVDLGARSGGQAFLPRSPSWPPPTSLERPPGHLPGDSVTQEQGLPYLRRWHCRIALPGAGGSLPSRGSPHRLPQLPTYRGSPGDTGTEARRALLLFLWSSLHSNAQPNSQQLLGPAPALHEALGRPANPHTYTMTWALGLAPFCRWGN